MAENQRIHPVDIEAGNRPSAPLVPREQPASDKGDPAVQQYPPPPVRRTIPVVHSRPPKRRHSCFCRCLCWSLLGVILFVVAIAATIGILYLVFDPKIPKYSVDRLSISAFSIDTNLTAHASFDVTVTANNPNKKIGIYYESGSHLSVWYSGTSLAEGKLPEFYQGHQNTTVMTVVLTGNAQQIGIDAMKALQQQQQTGSVPLEFDGDVPVKVKLGALKLWKMTFKVTCNLEVDSLSVGNQIKLKNSSCKIKLKL